MKIQCDVCGANEASVFCCADEAALCDPCDRRVHRANKLACKHRRFSLSPSDQSPPLCDICKERKGLVFCQEDRAILCRDCDDPIHSANELTMKHSRFLLTGARLSATPLSSDVTEDDHNKLAAVEESLSNSSSITEYLTKTLPGYLVEDLLSDDADGSYKDVYETVPFLDPDLAAAAIWVPQVPQAQQPVSFISAGLNGLIHCNYGFDAKEPPRHHGADRGTARGDDSFMVPQISTPVSSSSNKRPRPSSVWGF